MTRLVVRVLQVLAVNQVWGIFAAVV
jgi:hypothetical protein